jgi:hypothetical protein
MRRYAVVGISAVLVAAAAAGPASAGAHTASLACPPGALALGFSDALDKQVVNGVTVGGLSSLAFDRRSGRWLSTVDNHDDDPARIWRFTDPTAPVVVGDPIVLRRPDGIPYDGNTADDEGLAVLPNGDYLVSSETEPSIRVFGRDGVRKAQLPVPARFAVSGTVPGGEASANATLEGLTVAPSGRQVFAAMEGALSGDGDATLHRFLVYDADRHGRWHLTRQLAYHTEPGHRLPEIAAYRDGALLVEEAAFSTVTGNSIELYAVTGTDRARDVTRVPDLSAAPARDIVHKRLVADLVACPTLGTTGKQPQANPLLDNIEGMAASPTGRRGGPSVVNLVTDDNFGTRQTTRIVTLLARLP